MKQIVILLSLPFLFSCEETPEADYTYPKDTTNIVVKIYDCVYFKIKKPYYLIQWNDGTYGILYEKKENGGGNWYKASLSNDYHEFTFVLQDATHFKDSCSAKQDLQRYLDSRITYKIVK